MDTYDPMIAPDPEEWLALDEGERIQFVEQYHQHKKIRVPNVRAHAAFHAIVETQTAMGDESPVACKLQALLDEGLDRHEAIHAIGSVLADMMFKLTHGEIKGDPNLWYADALAKLTVK